MFHKILVPLDGSSFGEHALPWALLLARRSGASLQLAHVLQPFAGIYSEAALYLQEELQRQTRAQGQKYLDDVTNRLQSSPLAPQGPIESVLLEGEIAEALCERVANTGVDLVVLASHGRAPFARLWLGSTADELVRHAPTPVLVIRPSEEPPDLQKEPNLRHILIPLDGTPLAENILSPAITLGKLTGAGYTLLRIIKPLLPLALFPDGSGGLGQQVQSLNEQVQQIEERVRHEAISYLKQEANRFHAQNLHAQIRVLADESLAGAILHAIENVTLRPADELDPHPEENAIVKPSSNEETGEAPASKSPLSDPPVDLIALETHGRGGLSRMVMGSVADKVIRGAHIPVLVHHPVGT